MKRLLIFLFVGFYFSSCTKENKTSFDFYIKAKVIVVNDISCGYPLLDFSEDSLAIRSLMQREDISYIAKDLPQNLVIANQKLYVKVKPLNVEEDFPCLAIGVWWPHLKILTAKER